MTTGGAFICTTIVRLTQILLSQCQCPWSAVNRRHKDGKNELTTTFVLAPGALTAPTTWGTSQWSIFFEFFEKGKNNNRLMTHLL